MRGTRSAAIPHSILSRSSRLLLALEPRRGKMELLDMLRRSCERDRSADVLIPSPTSRNHAAQRCCDDMGRSAFMLWRHTAWRTRPAGGQNWDAIAEAMASTIRKQHAACALCNTVAIPRRHIDISPENTSRRQARGSRGYRARLTCFCNTGQLRL